YMPVIPRIGTSSSLVRTAEKMKPSILLSRRLYSESLEKFELWKGRKIVKFNGQYNDVLAHGFNSIFAQ
ncbi:hypothetical protein, partial [Marinifilum sp. D737]|uniref:hypothetical protein n=1 Tax=Marinifilum sp. D737 TaxID=2969628 RepID=UPI002275A6E2